MPSKGEKIVGIKSIAAYLQVSERTISRWEKDLGLPLYRVHGENGHTVYAFQNELDEFISAKNNNGLNNRYLNRFQKKLLLWAISVCTVLGLLIWLFYFNSFALIPVFSTKSNANPHFATLNGNSVEIRDADNNFLFQFTCEREWIKDPVSSRNFSIMDVDDDGLNEVFGIQYTRVSDRHAFTYYDDDGRINWQKFPENDQPYNNIIMDGDFFISYFQILRSGTGELRIVVIWQHTRRFLSLISSYDIDGNELNKYYHTGTVNSFRFLDKFGDSKDVLLFFGMNNILDGEGCIFALKLGNFFGVAPPYSVPPEYVEMTDELKDCVPDNPVHGNQIFYLRFKRPELLREYQPKFLGSELLDVSSDIFSVNTFFWEVPEVQQQTRIGFIFYIHSDLTINTITPHSVTIDLLQNVLDKEELSISNREILNQAESYIHKWEKGEWIPLKIADK